MANVAKRPNIRSKSNSLNEKAVDVGSDVKLEKTSSKSKPAFRKNSLERKLKEQEDNIAERFRELAILATMIVERDKHLKQVDAARQDLESRLSRLESDLLLERNKKRLTAQIYEAKLRLSKSVWNEYLTIPFRKILANLGRRDNEVSKLAKKSGLFDEIWYLAHYPDVAKADIAPWDHYLSYGASEGRDPSPLFSTNAYLENNPDVKEGGHNPLVHFINYGHAEDRWF